MRRRILEEGQEGQRLVQVMLQLHALRSPSRRLSCDRWQVQFRTTRTSLFNPGLPDQPLQPDVKPAEKACFRSPPQVSHPIEGSDYVRKGLVLFAAAKNGEAGGEAEGGGGRLKDSS